jgi:hypothetical protein
MPEWMHRAEAGTTLGGHCLRMRAAIGAMAVRVLAVLSQGSAQLRVHEAIARQTARIQ